MSKQAIQTDDPTLSTSRADIDAQLQTLIVETLSLDETRDGTFARDTGLFGHLPELDSMAVATLLTAVEDTFDFIIDDSEVDGEMLETYGGLLDFVEGKLVTG